MEVTMFYKGPDYIGHPLSNPARRAAVFSPVATARTSVPIVRSETTGNMITSVHEATHAAYNFYTRDGIFSAEIDRDGGGRFRTHAGDTRAPLTGREPPPGKVSTDEATKREWVSLLVGLATPRYAQRKYAGSTRFDSNCEHDFTLIDRVLTGISSSHVEKGELLVEIEARAARFVNAHWSAILRLASVICARGWVGEQEIRSALSRASSSIALNEAGASYANSLVSAGEINWGPFTWDDETDGADLLDEEGEDAVSYYHLGYDTEVVGTAKYQFPFGKGGEVYVKALLAAEKEGGTIGQYAAQLLNQITAMKKQSEANTLNSRGWGRAMPRRPGDEPNFFRRCDGYFR
jgi:hypothetical protein